MSTIRYFVAVQKCIKCGPSVKHIWQYASNVNIHSTFGHKENAKTFRSSDEARKWWDWAKAHFTEFQSKSVNYDWDTLCIVKQTIKEEVVENV